jgi:AcrR family transcriptional regulator
MAITGGDEEALRDHILRAAHQVITERGLAAASIRVIAEQAGVSPGTLYNYFDDHPRLLAKAIVHNAATLATPVADLPARAGRATLNDNLLTFVAAAGRVLDQLVPVFAASFANIEVLHALRQELATVETFQDPARTLTTYLLAEQQRGRIRSGVDCQAVAATVVSLCHSDAFDRHLSGSTARRSTRRKEIRFITDAITP